jgi:hypothetical protein
VDDKDTAHRAKVARGVARGEGGRGQPRPRLPPAVPPPPPPSAPSYDGLKPAAKPTKAQNEKKARQENKAKKEKEKMMKSPMTIMRW